MSKVRQGGRELASGPRRLPGAFEWKPGVGHSVPDRDKIAEMLKSSPRNPWPKALVWVQSDDVLKHFYWLESAEPTDKARLEATVTGNSITIKAQGPRKLAVWLDQALLDLDEPVTIVTGQGNPLTIRPKPDLETICRGIEERGDPALAAPVRIELP